MPKTPELNGLAERMNQTIMERVRSMLTHAKLSKTFWAGALSTATYVINRSPSVPLDEVSYRHLKVFGCLVYVHVAKDRRGKLDPKPRPCIFLGYKMMSWDIEYGIWLTRRCFGVGT